MKNIIIYILLSVSMSVLAQEQYKGKILDKDGKLLQGVLFYGDTSIIAVRHTPYSVSTILEDELQRSPELDINKSLYGKIAGLNVYQGAGTSSVNLATLQVHGSAPLVLIDGYPRDPSSITMSEIASFSLFTDAASAAMYGVRGGNGIINITTKKPGISPLQISVNYQYGISTKFRVPKFADSYTYAKNMNEAYRLDGLGRRYSDLELEAFQGGEFPFSFPDVDWQKEVYNDLGFNHQFNVLAKGGNERFRYVAGIIYSYDKAMFSHNDDDYRYTTKPFDSRLNLRTNIEVDLSKLTLLRVNLMGRLNEVNGANNINTFYNAVYTTPSAAFNVKNQSGIFGGNNIYGENNPVAMLGSSGHRKETLSTLFSDMSIKQDLPSITKGLYAQLSIAFDNRGVSWETSSKTYRYEDLRPTVHDDKQVTVNPIVYGTDSEVLSHGSGLTSVYINTDFQAQLGYNRSFGEHQLSGAAILDMQSSMVNGQNRSMKRQSWIASVYYAYKNKYVLNGVLNNSGSAVLPKNDRYILYPAVSASWIVSNEDFMNTKLVNSLRLKASFGLSGWDANTLHDLDIQNYEWSKGYYFGDNVGESSGYHEGRLPVENLTIEKSRKSTIGIDAGMFNDKLNLSAEVFYDRRTNILVNSSNSTSGIIGIEVGQLNAGIIDYKGIDLSLSYRDRISEFVYSISGIFSFTRDKQININEAYQEYDYLYHTGYSKNQVYGLEAIGLFNSQVEINNSPVQSFSVLHPGDIKYKDQNGDNVIDEKDVIRMYKTSVPEVYYGFSFNLAWRNFSMNVDFQGVTNKTVSLLNSPLYQPLVNNGNISQTFLDNEKTWTPEDPNNVSMPRLTTQTNNNNYRQGTLWYRNGSFLKLRNLEVAYDFPVVFRAINKMRLYLRGSNLFSIDHIKFADPEQLQASYPSLRLFWAGIKLHF